MNGSIFKYKIIVAYDGTRFGGWQIQPNTTSIQALIEAALAIVLRQKISVIGSGRTDAGVHARGQVAHFESSSKIDLPKLMRSLGALLPSDIRILNIEPTVPDFHARYQAQSKEYHYHILLHQTLDPFKRLYVYHHPYPLDLVEIEKGCRLLLGTHDFTSFANEASKGSAAKDPIRTLFRVQMHQEPGGIRLEFEGDGFLYKMVCNMTGTLLNIGKGKISAQSIPALFEAKDRRQASDAAPPQGLFLVKVNYTPNNSAEIASNEETCSRFASPL